MSKTTALNDDTHKCLKVMQTNLYEKYNIEMTIPDIIATIIEDADKGLKIILEKRRIPDIPIIKSSEVVRESI